MWQKIRICLFTVLFLTTTVVHARWASFDDAAVEVTTFNAQININADGTYDATYDCQIKILNERGRDTYAKLPLVYNFDNSKLEIIEAKTIIDGQDYPVTKELIEDKPLASEVNGFDQQHQVLLAFPNVKVGASIAYKYKVKLLKPDITGFYENFFDLSRRYYNDYHVQIRSQIPLYVDANNPGNYLSVKNGRAGKDYTLRLDLRKPIYIAIADEQSQLINPLKYPYVFVATNNSWPKFAQQFADPYIKVLKQPLPALYQSISDQAAQDSDPIERINIVASLLNNAVQYMGDWKSTKGRHVPQDLEKVASTRLGDCKDFATGMVAILQHLGYKANVVVAQRGEALYDTSEIKLPGNFHFNHALVRVELPNKRVLWVDPTNFISIADKTLPDIADRQAIILDATNSRLDKIPASTPQDKETVVTENIDLSNHDLVAVQGSMQLNGLAAAKYTGAGLQVSKTSIENFIMFEMGNYDNIVEKKVELPALDTRIVRDLTFKFNYKEKNMVLSSNAGVALLMSQAAVSNFNFNNEQVSDVYLGSPWTRRDVITLDNIKPVNTLPLDCSIQSPWADAKRTVKYDGNKILIEQEFKVKVSWLSIDTIRSKQYQEFAQQLAKNFKDGVAIVFEQ